MADISELNIGGTDYNVKDATARAGLASKANANDVYNKSDVDNKTTIEVVTVTGESTTVDNVTTVAATVASMLPNKFYKFTPALDSLTVTALGSATGLGVYAGKFTAASASTSLNFPASVIIADSVPDIEADHDYEFNIADNIFLMVDVTAPNS